MNDHTKNNLASIANIPQHLRNAEQALVERIDQGAAELRQIGVAASAAATRFALEVIAAEDRLATACGRIGEIAANLVQQMGELVARMGAMFTTNTTTTTSTTTNTEQQPEPGKAVAADVVIVERPPHVQGDEPTSGEKAIRDACGAALADQPESPVKVGLDAVNHRLNADDDGTAEQQEQQVDAGDADAGPIAQHLPATLSKNGTAHMPRQRGKARKGGAE